MKLLNFAHHIYRMGTYVDDQVAIAATGVRA